MDEEWNENVPNDDTLARDIDNEVREFKRAIRERLAEEHNFYEDESDHDDVGEHKRGSARVEFGESYDKKPDNNSDNPGLVFCETDTGRIYFDDGEDWVNITSKIWDSINDNNSDISDNTDDISDIKSGDTKVGHAEQADEADYAKTTDKIDEVSLEHIGSVVRQMEAGEKYERDYETNRPLLVALGIGDGTNSTDTEVVYYLQGRDGSSADDGQTLVIENNGGEFCTVEAKIFAVEY